MERETLKEHSEEPHQGQAPADPDSAKAIEETEFPNEPFGCPYCGQLLASHCRTCVSCKRTIDPRDITGLEPPAPEPSPEHQRITQKAEFQEPREYARFSWNIFLGVILAWFVIAYVLQRFLPYRESQFVLAGLVASTSCWVYFDARGKEIPKAAWWAIGSLLLWIFFFPWYLARRRRPDLPCPFVESDRHRAARIVLIAFLVFLIITTILAILIPSRKQKANPTPNSHIVMLNQPQASRWPQIKRSMG